MFVTTYLNCLNSTILLRIEIKQGETNQEVDEKMVDWIVESQSGMRKTACRIFARKNSLQIGKNIDTIYSDCSDFL